MSSIDASILKEFQVESKQLVLDLLNILEQCEGDFAQVRSLEDYGQTVDRIMGGAKNLALLETNNDHLIHKVGDYAALCKTVGYKASQIKDNPSFYNICVALLLDATEMLQQMVENLLSAKQDNFKELFTRTFIDRLKWISSEFSSDVRASVDVHQGKKAPKMKQNEIDELLKKLGID